MFLLLLLVLLMQDKLCEASVGELKCTADDRACVIPFVFRGIRYTKCTTFGNLLRDGSAWCPVSIDLTTGAASISRCAPCKAPTACYKTLGSFEENWSLDCPGGCAALSKVVGSASYTEDSFACSAAIHHGSITDSGGGALSITNAGNQNQFEGTLANGILSQGNQQAGTGYSFGATGNSALPTLIIADGDNILQHSSPGTVPQTLISNQGAVVPVTLDRARNKLFWSNTRTRTIMSADYTGSPQLNVEEVLSDENVVKVEGMAVDWVNKKLYWTDAARHSILVSEYDGDHVSTLIQRSNDYKPRAIALDPSRGLMFVSDWGLDAKIERCSMAGGEDDCVVIVRNDITWPNSIVIDGDKLYWTDAKLKKIYSSTLDGTEKRVVVQGGDKVKHAFGLAIDDDRLYWTDWEIGGLLSVNKNTGKDYRINLLDLIRPSGLVIVQDQPIVRNACAGKFCSHLCLLSPDGGKCKCSNGFQASSPDGAVCRLSTEDNAPKPGSKIAIAIADFNAIRRLDIDLENRKTTSINLVTGIRRAFAVDIDVLNTEVFWADNGDRAIRKGIFGVRPIEVADWQTFLPRSSGYVGQIESIAIDDLARLIFWTDSILHGVFVANLDEVDGRIFPMTIIKRTVQYKPSGLALDHANGYMYVSDVGVLLPKIEKCEMAFPDACVNFVTQNVFRPVAITIDHAARRLYWSDSTLKYIHWVNMDGNANRTVFVRSPTVTSPFGIGVFNDRVYFGDWQSRDIRSTDKFGKNGHQLQSSLMNPRQFTIYDVITPRKGGRVNHCLNHECKYLCVPTIVRVNDVQHACKCPDGLRGVSQALECSNTSNSKVLVCEEGFVLSADRQACVDINECNQNNGGCSQVCGNTKGSFQCSCQQWFKLESDGVTCTKIDDLCLNDPCFNGGTCHMNDEKTEFHCSCPTGYGGPHCKEVTVKLVKPTGLIYGNGTVTLKCLAPATLTNTIIWRRNRREIDREQGISFDTDRRTMSLIRPTYVVAGLYECQVRIGGREYFSTAILKIETNPNLACGRAAGFDDAQRSTEQRILGGRFTAHLQAPFVVMLYRTRATDEHDIGVFCGGSIIDTKHVLTAAHCLLAIELKDLRLYVGRRDTKVDIKEIYDQVMEVKREIRHPDFDGRNLHADLTILELKEEIYYSNGVKPVCILPPSQKSDKLSPRPNKNGKPKFALVFGWGFQEDNTVSRFLREVKLPLKSNSDCVRAYPNQDVTKLMVCAGGEFNKDACNGDSGGPMVLWSGSQWYLAGVVSWGESCGAVGKPGVYARIGTTVRQWIYDNTNLQE